MRWNADGSPHDKWESSDSNVTLCCGAHIVHGHCEECDAEVID